MNDEFTQTPDEIIAEILGRYSVLDLREQTDADLNRGYAMLSKSEKSLTITDQGEANLIRFWKIESNGTPYEVRRFENWCFCSCPDHFYRHSVCRHIAATTRFYCERCQKREVTFGMLCEPCQMDTAPLLRPSRDFKPSLVGRIRV